jgi:hypothetical protein
MLSYHACRFNMSRQSRGQRDRPYATPSPHPYVRTLSNIVPLATALWWIVMESVGGSSAEVSLRAMAWEGRCPVLSFASGEIPRIPLNLFLLKGFSIVGVCLLDVRGARSREAPRCSTARSLREASAFCCKPTSRHLPTHAVACPPRSPAHPRRLALVVAESRSTPYRRSVVAREQAFLHPGAGRLC